MKTHEERFWEKVDKSGDCWLWTAYTDKDGYGKINIGGKVKYVHRVSWEMHKSPIPGKRLCLHSCNQLSCVRPDHLFIGRYQDNINMRTLEDRFWAKVNKQVPGECWGWDACLNKAGYGMFGVGAKMKIAHRVSWELHNGLIPEGLCVLHKCDNPICTRPSHLFLGTMADNVSDMHTKGRAPCLKGESSSRAKLNEGAVKEIRRLYADGRCTQKWLAMVYGIKHQSIALILNRKNWVHI